MITIKLNSGTVVQVNTAEEAAVILKNVQSKESTPYRNETGLARIKAAVNATANRLGKKRCVLCGAKVRKYKKKYCPTCKIKVVKQHSQKAVLRARLKREERSV